MDACAAIYRRYGTACFNLALRILGERAAAEDVVQEVFLKMMNTLSGFRGDAPFGVWLKRMTANATIDALRAGQRFADEDPEALFASMASRAIDADARVDAWTLLMRLPGPLNEEQEHQLQLVRTSAEDLLSRINALSPPEG